MTEPSTVDKAKEALRLGCGMKMTASHDIQSGWAWHVTVQDWSRVTQSFVWIFLGFVSGDDKKAIEDYGASIGRSFTQKEQAAHSVWPEPFSPYIDMKPSKRRKKGRRVR